MASGEQEVDSHLFTSIRAPFPDGVAVETVLNGCATARNYCLVRTLVKRIKDGVFVVKALLMNSATILCWLLVTIQLLQSNSSAKCVSHKDIDKASFRPATSRLLRRFLSVGEQKIFRQRDFFSGVPVTMAFIQMSLCIQLVCLIIMLE